MDFAISGSYLGSRCVEDPSSEEMLILHSMNQDFWRSWQACEQLVRTGLLRCGYDATVGATYTFVIAQHFRCLAPGYTAKTQELQAAEQLRK